MHAGSTVIHFLTSYTRKDKGFQSAPYLRVPLYKILHHPLDLLLSLQTLANTLKWTSMLIHMTTGGASMHKRTIGIPGCILGGFDALVG